MSGTPVAGREGELEALAGVLDAVTGGEQRLLVLRGEAGIGKTRLLDVLRAWAAERRFLVLDGRCAELEHDVPLAAVVDAVEPHLPGVDDPLLRRLGDERLGRLAELFPELRAGGPAPAAAGSAAERWRLHRALRDLLDLLASRTPVVVVLDDVHWADPATLELLDHLVRRPPRGRHLLVLAARPGEAADRLLAARRATGPGATVLLDLRPLDRAAAEGLLGGIADPADRERAFLASGGNPLLLGELARDGGRADVPGGVVAAVRAEIDGLPLPARALLDAGAVAGDPFDLDLAAAMAGLDPEAALAALDVLAARDLLRAEGGPRRFAFRHPVIRSAVYQALPAGTRLARHAAAAAALATAGAPPPAQARHLFHTATPGDLAAAATLRAAAAAVRPQAPAIAADWLLAARRADALTDAARLAELGAVLAEAGRLAEALTALDEALAAVDSDGAAALQVELDVRAAALQRRLGRHADAARRLERSLGRRPHDARVEGRLLTERAMSAYYAADWDDMAGWAERAWATERALGPVVRAAAAAMTAAGRAFGGDAAGADAAATEAVASIAAATDEELAAESDYPLIVAWALVAQERLGDGLAVAERTATAVRRVGHGSAAVALDVAAVLALGLFGRVDEAVGAADRAEHAARVSGNAQSVQWALWMRAWALLEQGELDDARAAAHESVVLAEALDDSALVGIARAVLGAVLVACGDPDGGRRLIESADGDVDPAWACRWAPWVVDADLALGDTAAAAAHAERAEARAGRLGLAGATAAASRAEARLALALDDGARALAGARRAIEQAERIGGAVDVVRGRLLAGRALASSDRAAALDELTAAERGAAEAGARRLREEAVRELRRLGRRVGRGGRRAAGEGLAALSDRERQVAALVATGATNRAIGERLFLSEKTVESHLSQVFRKLSVRSRAEVAARVGAGGL